MHMPLLNTKHWLPLHTVRFIISMPELCDISSMCLTVALVHIMPDLDSCDPLHDKSPTAICLADHFAQSYPMKMPFSPIPSGHNTALQPHALIQAPLPCVFSLIQS